MMKNLKAKLSALLFTAVASNQAVAATDWSGFEVDFSGEITAIIALVGVIGAVMVVSKGGRMLLSMLR